MQQCCPTITQSKRPRQENHELEGNVGHSETLPQSQHISIPSAVTLLCSITAYAGQHIKFAIAHIHATKINPQTPRAASEAWTPFCGCAAVLEPECESVKASVVTGRERLLVSRQFFVLAGALMPSPSQCHFLVTWEMLAFELYKWLCISLKYKKFIFMSPLRCV